MRQRQRSRLVAMVVAVDLVVGTLLAIAAPASTTPAWSVQKTASPSAATFSEFWVMSCPSTGSCFAGGLQTGGSDAVTLVDRYV